MEPTRLLPQEQVSAYCHVCKKGKGRLLHVSVVPIPGGAIIIEKHTFCPHCNRRRQVREQRPIEYLEHLKKTLHLVEEELPGGA